MEGFTLGLTVKKEVLKVVPCSVSLTLTLNLETDTLFEELKKVTSTMTPQNVLSEAQVKNGKCQLLKIARCHYIHILLKS